MFYVSAFFLSISFSPSAPFFSHLGQISESIFVHGVMSARVHTLHTELCVTFILLLLIHYHKLDGLNNVKFIIL